MGGAFPRARRSARRAAGLFLLLAGALPPAAGEDVFFAAAPGAPEPGSRAAVLLDALTGTVLFEKNPDMEIPPASLTKLVTMHLALEEVAAGRADLDETVPLPEESHAGNQPARSSLMFLGPGQTVTLRELLLGLSVSSGNDAALAVALRFAPGVDEFAGRMNGAVRGMGLARTRFVEPSGVSELNSTTAGEFAFFCRNYVGLHPEALGLFHSVTSFAYPGAGNLPPAYRDDPGTIVQFNRNRLLGTVEGVDGLKTGYVDEAGYNIALTAERRGTRLIAVVLGAPASPPQLGERIRDEDGARLLDWGFARFRTLRPALADPGPARVWKGRSRTVPVVWAEPLPFTIPADRGSRLTVSLEYALPLVAPLPRGSAAGRAVLSDSRGELRSIPFVTSAEVPPGGFFRRLRDGIELFLRAIFR